VAKQIANPRELEAQLLLAAAARLQAVLDAWKGRSGDLEEALLFNRKLWTIFVTSVVQEDNPLPREIRQNVANLGLFVLNQTVGLLADPQPERMIPLININRELAAGLLGH
jgi:flagellar protein FlaF